MEISVFRIVLIGSIEICKLDKANNDILSDNPHEYFNKHKLLAASRLYISWGYLLRIEVLILVDDLSCLNLMVGLLLCSGNV